MPLMDPGRLPEVPRSSGDTGDPGAVVRKTIDRAGGRQDGHMLALGVRHAARRIRNRA